MAELSTDWLSEHMPLWEELLAGYRGRPGLRFLEVGSFEGCSAVWLLENILTHRTARLVCVGTFQGRTETKRPGAGAADLYARFCRNVQLYWRKVQIIRGVSQEALRDGRLAPESFDFACLGGSRRARDVLEDAVLAFRLLKPGGRLIFDDYGWEDAPEETERPRLGIDAFLNVYQGAYSLVHRGYQLAIVKAG
jgi:predicted O-methyltransferase YrrM